MKLNTIIFITVLFLLIPSVAAERIEISQGDLVYMGETVDISRAIAWPDYTICWCAANNPECDPPDQTIEVSGYMYHYYIDPNVFHYGTYYRWDGEWHPQENAVAFTIVHGNRSDYKKHNVTEEEQAPAQIKDHDGPYTYYISKGDTPTVYTRLNRTDDCYLWIFSNNADIYGEKMVMSNESGEYHTYSYGMTEDETENIAGGDYDGYIQCAGDNGVQDIFVNDETEFDTLFDDGKIPDVPINPDWDIIHAKTKFDKLTRQIQSPAFDDTLIEIKAIVSEPYIAISDITRNEDDTRLYIGGTTSWQNETSLTFKLDPDNYVLAQDIRFHTWTTYAKGEIDSPRTFRTALSIDKDELTVGDHEIEASVTDRGDLGKTTYVFKISTIYVMPTPTPEIRKVIYDSSWNNIALQTAATPTPTPTIAPVATEIIITPDPVIVTPATTKTIPTVGPASAPPETTQDPNIYVPLPAWVPVLSLIIAIAWQRRRKP